MKDPRSQSDPRSTPGKYSRRDRLLATLFAGVYFGFYLLYVIFGRRFAEIHIGLPFLDFPIFVGELFLGFGIGVFLLMRDKAIPIGKNSLAVLLGYAVFVGAKALYGYIVWGPLALRHSALFYYPLVGLMGYVFYPKIHFRYVLYPFLCLLIALGYDSDTFRYTNLFLSIVIVWVLLKSRLTRFLLVSIILSVFFWEAYPFFTSHRAGLISFLFALIALGFMTLLTCWKTTKSRIFSAAVLMSLIVAAIGFSLRSESMQALVYFKDFRATLEAYHQETEGAVLENKGWEIKLYEKGKDRFRKEPKEGEPIPELRIGQLKRYKELNVIWRLLVWEDMIDDLFRNNVVWGVDFGKPFRSPRIEAWGASDGWNVGWLEPHNSYLHFLYRAGCVGLVFMAIYFARIGHMAVQCFRIGRTAPYFLMAFILYWLVYPLFVVTLELPYYAIPYWGVFGFSLGYIDSQERVRLRPGQRAGK